MRKNFNCCRCKTNVHANNSDAGWHEIGWLYLFQFLIFIFFFSLSFYRCCPCCRCRCRCWMFFFRCVSFMAYQALDDYEIEEDLPNAMKLLGEMNNNVKQVSDLVESMLQRVKSGELTTEYGLSFLEVRYHMLLTYLINLTYVVLRKCSGNFKYSKSIRNRSFSMNILLHNMVLVIRLTITIKTLVNRQNNPPRSIYRSLDRNTNSIGENTPD